ncbi:HXXEE domain-containing protein [Roseococcus sp. SYP-B2431]|uniref:HXXEE domain-containing protein n=1 Tax=Roseococcus sp. SYP-B2431 TaxID=2496640 RepID=UPI0010409B02|nr:HXXEE domain-containing protein [Roseococcus sp. SYP-B2431]TCH96620.1 HXXEE domain-containing protein [Roseococcus sp. SYP-B2431]
MTLQDLLWLSTAAYAAHVIEEFTLDWRGWAQNVLGLPAEWPNFYVVNAVVAVLGAAAAMVAPNLPAVALAFPALMLINATFFHVLPAIRFGGRFSPGLISAVLLFYPLGIACYAVAEVGWGALALSVAIGAGLMAWPVALLMVKDRPYFRQDR